MNSADIIGRFAPSPTGDLHFGSLTSAVGSYLAARSCRGQWLIRIEDLDPPREIEGSADSILHDLGSLGLKADAAVLYQSSRSAAYQQAVDYLLKSGQAYYCGCSRKQLPDSGIYPGTCRNGISGGKKPRSVRFLINQQSCTFTDRVQGVIEEYMSSESGDFIIKRADGLHAYHLAVVLDDHFQGVTQVVRGADLLDSTSKQICLQRAMGIATPEYMHLPIAFDDQGQKLSKRDHSDPIGQSSPAGSIELALRFLGQQPPAGLPLNELWRWAASNWDEQRIPREVSVFDRKDLN